MGNTFGKIFKITTFGESHGDVIGAVVDGCPGGLRLAASDFKKDMACRRPNDNIESTTRRETDEVQILSGVFEGLTLGTPIALLIKNTDHNSADYEHLRDVFRLAHGDYTYYAKFGHRDYRGGGRASGRETAARVAAGVVAKLILNELGINIISDYGISYDECLEEIIADGDAVGSVVTCVVNGLKTGVGQPVFDKLDAELAKALMSIGASRAVEFAQGINAVKMRASQHNILDKGILAGISDGNDITVKVHFKPPPSIGVGGRHDRAIAPRAVVVCEAMIAIVLVDHIFCSFSDNMQAVKANYCSKI